MSNFLREFNDEIASLERQVAEKREAYRSRAEARLREISEARAALDNEENEIRSFLGLTSGTKKGKARKAGTRTISKRIPTAEKKAIVAQFVAEGHIQANAELTPSLRAALTDAGLRSYDFPKIGSLLPEGWSATSNGQRGLLAKTVFHKS
jgi:phage I-like protein